jgi:Zn-dependent protease
VNCDFCGRLLVDRILVCPCGRLAYGMRIAARAREAEALEKEGATEAARAAWLETLAWLPVESSQANEIRNRVAKLEGVRVRPNVAAPAGLAGGIGALLLGLKAKLGFVVALAKGSKVLLTGLTMLLSIWVYMQWMGAPFATLFVLLIWVHEMGHVIALGIYGIPASAPVFIPLVGALIRSKQNPSSCVADSWVGLAGPLLGSVGGWGALALGHALESDLLLAVGYVTIGLQLFNLIPLYPLDGGRASSVLTTELWLGCLAALVALAWSLGEPVVVFLAFLPLGRIAHGSQARKLGGPAAEYWQASSPQRVAATAAYVGLVALLVWTHVALQPTMKAVAERHKGVADLAWISSETE